MTRQEAADFISGNIMWGEYTKGKYGEALAMAIRSLEAWNNVFEDIRFLNDWTGDDGYWNGVNAVIRIIDRHLSEVES